MLRNPMYTSYDDTAGTMLDVKDHPDTNLPSNPHLLDGKPPLHKMPEKPRNQPLDQEFDLMQQFNPKE